MLCEILRVLLIFYGWLYGSFSMDEYIINIICICICVCGYEWIDAEDVVVKGLVVLV